MGWVKYSTVGAKAGSDLKDSAGNVLADTAVKNAEITLNAAGYLNNIGTTEKFKNALITTKADGTLNYDGTGAVAPSLASLTGTVGKASGGFGTSMASSTGIVRFASGTLNTDSTLSTTYTDATDNGTTINSSGNVAGVITVGSNISISSTSEYILISD